MVEWTAALTVGSSVVSMVAHWAISKAAVSVGWTVERTDDQWAVNWVEP
jgi:hypothetical protein